MVIERLEEIVSAYVPAAATPTPPTSPAWPPPRSAQPKPEDHLILPEIISKEPLASASARAMPVSPTWCAGLHFLLLTAEENGVTAGTSTRCEKDPRPEVARMFSKSGGLGPMLGLDNKWAVQRHQAGRQLRRDVGPHPDADGHAARHQQALDQGRAAVLAADPLIASGGRRRPAPHPAGLTWTEGRAMSQTTIDPRSLRAPPRRPFRLSWSDPRFRAIVWQVVIVGVVGAIVWYLVANTNRNLAARHIATGFGFLGRDAGIPIGETLIDVQPGRRHLRPGAADRPAEHAEGRRRRHRAGDHPRHADRHRPAVEELAAGASSTAFYVEVHPRHAAAAATAVLVRDPAGLPGAAPGAAARWRACSCPTAASSCRWIDWQPAHYLRR